MAALTWRNVDAPNLAVAVGANDRFAQLLTKGFDTAREGLKTYDDQTTDEVNKAFSMELAGLHGLNQEQVGPALQGVLAKFAPHQGRLSYENLTALNNKYGQLSQEQLTGLNIANTQADQLWEKHTRDRTLQHEGAEDAAAPMLANFYALSQKAEKDPEAAKQLAALNADPEFQKVVAAMGPEEFAKAMTTGAGLQRGQLSLAGDRLGNTIRSTEFNQGQEDRKEGREVDALMPSLINSSTSMSEFAQAVQDEIKAGHMTGRQGTLALERAGKYANFIEFQDAGGAAVGGGGGGAGAFADPTRIMNYQARAAGFGSVPDSVKTLGQASDFALKVNAAGVDSSAMGTFQIVGQTLRSYAPKVFGKDWRNTDFNAANQDKLAEAIFNDNKGSASALRKQWVSLSPQNAELVRHMDWAQARQVIAQGESGSTAAQLAKQGAGIQTATARSENGNRIFEVQQLNMENWNGQTSPAQVASSLVGEGGDYAGGNMSDVLGYVNDIRTKYGVNAATAGALLRKAADKQDWATWFKGGFGRGTKNISVNWDTLDQYASAFKDKTALVEAAQSRQGLEQATATQGAYTQQVAALEKQLASYQAAAMKGKNVTRQIGQTMAALQQARSLADASTSGAYSANGFSEDPGPLWQQGRGPRR